MVGIRYPSGILIALSLLVAACGGAAAPASTKDPLGGRYTLVGGGGALDAVNALTGAFSKRHPSVTWLIDDVGSDGGVRLVATGGADLGMISRDLKGAEKGSVGTLSIGISGTAVAVNAANPVTGLTRDQVRRIYSGEITDWSLAGGSPGTMTVLVREATSSTRSAFESYFFTSAPTYGKSVIEVHELGETLKTIASFKDAVGMVTISNATLRDATITLLAIDGVAATKENLVSGAYPIRRPLHLVHDTDPAKLKPAVRAFLDFVRGPDGQKVIAGL